jgi:ketosteroid isomerase-like protein
MATKRLHDREGQHSRPVNKATLILIGLLALVPTSCPAAAGQAGAGATATSGPAQSSAHSEDDATGIRRLAQDLADAIRAGDVNRIMARYQHSDRLVIVESPPHPRTLGWTAYRQEWLRFFHQIRKLDRWALEAVQAEASGQEGRLALRWRLGATTLEGKKTAWEGRMEDIVRKIGNRWVIVRERLWWSPSDLDSQGPGGGKPAPASTSLGGPARDGSPGIEGVVIEGPLTPSQRQGAPNDRPLANAIVSVQPDGGGKEITRVQADGQGRFHLKLAPGSYWLFTQAPPGHRGINIPKPSRVQVPAGKWVQITLQHDTGIR